MISSKFYSQSVFKLVTKATEAKLVKSSEPLWQIKSKPTEANKQDVLNRTKIFPMEYNTRGHQDLSSNSRQVQDSRKLLRYANTFLDNLFQWNTFDFQYQTVCKCDWSRICARATCFSCLQLQFSLKTISCYKH